MKTNEKTAEKTREKKLRFLPFRNSLYLTSSKAFITFLVALMTFFASSQTLDVILKYTEEPSYVVNVFTQSGRFDYRESKPFKLEVENALKSILEYSLRYQTPEGFSSPDLIRFSTESENENCRKQVKNVLEILNYEIGRGEVEEQYLENGFVRETADGTFEANTAVIEEYYQKQYDALIEDTKRLDEDYRKVAEYIESMRGVKFAVYDRSAQRLVSNTEVTKREDAQKLFSTCENSLMVFNSKSPYFVPGSLRDFVPIVQELAEDYDSDFDIFISFSEGFVFNDECEKIEGKYKEVFSFVAKHLTAAAVFSLLGLALTVLILKLSGHREHGGAPRYSLADKLPNELHIFLHLAIMLSMAWLVEDSVYIILNPHLNISWLTVSPDYFVLRAEICSVIGVLFLIAAVCCVKRHYLHKTLFSNTVIYKTLSLFKKEKREDRD